MEILFIALIVIQIVATAIYAIAIKNRIKERSEESDRNNRLRHEHMMLEIEQINRSLLARDNPLTTKPIKPNNWDSVKSCFKSPSRVDVNERN